MGKLKISELSSANIEATDLIPFVKVPANNGIKSNKKITYADLRAAILNGFNAGGTTQFVHVPQLNNVGNNQFGFGGIWNQLIPNGGSAQALDSDFVAAFDNSTNNELKYEYSQHLKVSSLTNTHALDYQANAGMLVAKFKVLTLLNIDGGSAITTNQEIFEDKFFMSSDGCIYFNNTRTYFSQTNFILIPGSQAIIHNMIVVDYLDYYVANTPVPQPVNDLLTIHVENNMFDNALNTKIFS